MIKDFALLYFVGLGLGALYCGAYGAYCVHPRKKGAFLCAMTLTLLCAAALGLLLAYVIPG